MNDLAAATPIIRPAAIAWAEAQPRLALSAGTSLTTMAFPTCKLRASQRPTGNGQRGYI